MYCAGGLFQNPSGDWMCWVSALEGRKIRAEAKQECLDHGFEQLAEFRTPEDFKYMSNVDYCK